MAHSDSAIHRADTKTRATYSFLLPRVTPSDNALGVSLITWHENFWVLQWLSQFLNNSRCSLWGSDGTHFCNCSFELGDCSLMAWEERAEPNLFYELERILRPFRYIFIVLCFVSRAISLHSNGHTINDSISAYYHSHVPTDPTTPTFPEAFSLFQITNPQFEWLEKLSPLKILQST